MKSKQDIITSIRNLDLFLRIPELKGAKPRLTTNGNPFAFTGGFNMVFQLEHNEKKWALRVWHAPMGENKERYLAISKYLSDRNLPYFAEFIYDENSLLINGELTDTIRMEWIEGNLLKDYIEKNLNNKETLRSLANNFLVMTKALREEKISHGDLQEGNIIVSDSGNIKLVDYDSICIPEIEGKKELVNGLKGYQHPSRLKNGKASLKADYFSELIIYLSILGISEKKELWNKYQVKDSPYLLFNENDFERLESSNIYKDLIGINPVIDSILSVLKGYLQISNYLDLQPFSNYFNPPKILSFNSNKEVVLEGIEIQISWEVENALQVRIEPEIGIVPAKGKHTFKPKSQNYKLITTGFNENVEETINIKLFPIPLIETMLIPTPSYPKKPRIEIKINDSPYINLSIIELNTNIRMNKTIIESNIPSINFTEIPTINVIYPRKKKLATSKLTYLMNILSQLNNKVRNYYIKP